MLGNFSGVLRKTVKAVAGYLELGDSCQFLKNYLPCLIENWYKMTESLEEFPISLLNCTSEREFYDTTLPLFAPLFAQEADLRNLGRVAAILNTSTKEIVEVSEHYRLRQFNPGKMNKKMPLRCQNLIKFDLIKFVLCILFKVEARQGVFINISHFVSFIVKTANVKFIGHTVSLYFFPINDRL